MHTQETVNRPAVQVMAQRESMQTIHNRHRQGQAVWHGGSRNILRAWPRAETLLFLSWSMDRYKIQSLTHAFLHLGR